MRLPGKGDLLSVAQGFIHHDEPSLVLFPKLLVGVQQLDAVDRAIRREIHIHIGHVVPGIAGQFQN